MPTGSAVFATILLSLQLLAGIFLNSALILTICLSPTLYTPPNAHLINICVTNCVLLLSTLLSLVSLSLRRVPDDDDALSALGVTQMFLTTICYVEYFVIFSAIGYYRYKTIKKETFSLRDRAIVIRQTILWGWITSIVLSLALTLTFYSSLTSLTWNSFRYYIDQYEIHSLDYLSSLQTAALYFACFILIVCGILIVKSYYYVLKTLCKSTPVGKSSVHPINRHPSESSETTEVFGNSSLSYRPAYTNGTSTHAPPFVISSMDTYEHFVVHYQRRSQTVLIEDTFALENPIKAQQLLFAKQTTKTPLQPSLSVNSQSSGSRKDFTDISQNGEMLRFQQMKNRCALRNMSLRSERKNLGSTTRNGLIMIGVFLFCSVPGFVCSIPGVLSADLGTNDFTSILMYFQLLFYMNSIAYPVWYLVFSKRVRKCASKLYDNLYFKLCYKH